MALTVLLLLENPVTLDQTKQYFFKRNDFTSAATGNKLSLEILVSVADLY